MAEQQPVVEKSGIIMIKNDRLEDELPEGGADYLYHLGLHSKMDLKGTFNDVKFVLMCGSDDRAIFIAGKVREGLSEDRGNEGAEILPTGPIGKTERYVLFKVGPVIIGSHGMGMPSMSIFMHEITKLLFYAEAKDVTYIRVGTSGGLGIPPGTVVVANGAVNGTGEPFYTLPVLGKMKKYDTTITPGLAHAIAGQAGGILTAVGNTMGTDCFYEGQGRLDGAICEYTRDEKMAFLKYLHEEKGVRNIEMEGPYFAAFCHRLKIPGTLVCCTLVNRLLGDQISSTPAELRKFADNAVTVAVNYVRHVLRSE